MPVTLKIPSNNAEHSLPAKHRRDTASAGRVHAKQELSIGLVNNMPDGALEATERQFLSLLEAASGDFEVQLTLFYLPGVPRGESAMARIRQQSLSAESLSQSGLDGLIVTGREPLSPRLQDEPYWGSFVQLLEWARTNTCSTVWSCLAAHAAVLHMHGIQRRKNHQKYCGIFACDRISSHPLNANAPARFRMPHSRWNGLPEDELAQCGYQILSRAGDAGVDCFVKQERSLFVFFQGHPEYEPDTLLLEYRRDVARYLRGECAAFPSLPHGYFDSNTESVLREIEREAAVRPQDETLQRVAALRPSQEAGDGWRPAAVSLYRNWLEYIRQQKGTRVDAAAPAQDFHPDSLYDVQPELEEPCGQAVSTD